LFTASLLDLIQPKRHDGKTDATDLTDKNGFFPPAAEKGEPKVSQNPF